VGGPEYLADRLEPDAPDRGERLTGQDTAQAEGNSYNMIAVQLACN
jgi:hypothetical protein